MLCISASNKKRKGKTGTIKVFSVYTEGESQGIELAICNELIPSLVEKRTRIFEKEGETWGHLTANSKEMRVWLMADINSSSDLKSRDNFLSALRLILTANQKTGTQFFTKNRSRLTFSIEGWESKKPGNFVFETEGKIYRGEGKARGVLKQVNINGKPFFKPDAVDFLLLRSLKLRDSK